MGGEAWFKQAMGSNSGDDYGMQEVHTSGLANNERVLIYSCGVREGGRSDGRLLGALGIVFNWDSLAQTVVKQTPLSSAEWARARVCIADSSGHILADSQDKQLQEQLPFQSEKELFSEHKGFKPMKIDGIQTSVAHCASFGFETYRCGWHSFVMMKQ